MEKLSWEMIDSGATFQRLVNDLFALEINNPAFLSGNPDIGKDAGWDGRYEGIFMGISGLWSFQAKWTKNNLTSAYNALRPQLEEELKKASRNKVDTLLFVTNADLQIGTEGHVGKLEKLNENQKYVKQLFVWQRADLESRIKQYPLLRYLYFGDSQNPMFVSPSMFAEKEDLLDGVLVERKEEFEKFKEFILDDKRNILIVHAVGGCGKTHFIAEAGKVCHVLNPKIQARYCRPNIRNVDEAINEELNHEKDYVIFLDDAERYLDDAKKLIAHTRTYSPGKLKIVLSSRSSGKEIVRNLAHSQRIYDCSEFELSQISEDGLINILIHSAGSKPISYPERIVRELNGNLFLIVTTGKLIHGSRIDPKLIKTQIKESLDREAAAALIEISSFDESSIKLLLRELSIVVPFPAESREMIVEKLSSILRLDVQLLDGAIDRLVETNILRLVGASIRFNPDMKGDIYLSVNLDRSNGEKLINQVFENWLSVYPEKITANIAAASRHSETDSAGRAVKGLIKKWIGEVSSTSEEQKASNLKMITPIAYLAPGEAIGLMYSYIDSTAAIDAYGLGRDAYGPIIYQILHLPGLQKEALDLIRYIDQKKLNGTYTNYEPGNLIRQATSPLELDIKLAIDSLSELLIWVSGEGCTDKQARLVSEGVRESLAGSHEYRESYGNQMTFGRRVLLYEKSHKEVVDRYRDKGMEILCALIFHPNNKIKKIGIEIADDIGHESASVSDAFLARIILDRKKVIAWMQTLIGELVTHEVTSEVEDVLIKYWASNNLHENLSVETADILRGISRPPEYVIFKYFVSSGVIIGDFLEIEKNAPATDRWSWLVHNHFRRNEFDRLELDATVEQLAKKYVNASEIIAYLRSLDSETQDIRSWGYVPLIETWAKFNNEAFIEIVNSANLLNRVPSIFQLGIHKVASDQDKSHVLVYAKEILDNLEDLDRGKVDVLLDLLSEYDVPTAEFMPCLVEIIKNADTYLKSNILHKVFFIFNSRSQEEKVSVGVILEVSLTGSVDSHVLDMFNFLLSQAIEWDLPEKCLSELRIALFEIIKNIEKIDYHTDELIKFVIHGDLERFIALVDYRLKKYQENPEGRFSGYFDPIPFEGFQSLGDLIKSYSDFSKLMDKINIWQREGVLYSFDIEHLVKNCKNHDEEIGGYFKMYVEDKIKQGDIDNIKIAINALYGIHFGKDSADLFLSTMVAAEKIGELKDVESVLSHQVISGGYSGTLGVAPPILVEKQEALLEISAKAPHGEIKNCIDLLAESVSRDIQRHLEEAQEFMTPKA